MAWTSDHLSALYFGKDDAESDVAPGGLLKASFLETAAYKQANSGKKRLIVGRKGAGKSAICMRLLSPDQPGSYACLIAPDEVSADELRRFELQGVSDEQAKAVLWRYIISVQVAKWVVAHAHGHAGKEPDEVKSLRRFLGSNGEGEDLAFRERFYQIIQRIKSSVSVEAFGVKLAAEMNSAPSEGARIDQQVDVIEQYVKSGIAALDCAALHGPLLIVIDQLENVWSNDRASDDVVIGLLLAVKRLTSAGVSGGFPNVRCVVFLRTDIYDLLHFDEGDKFRGDEWRIDWSADRLLELVELRAKASVGLPSNAPMPWDELFPASVRGVPTRQFLVEHTLMRPRDVIQLCNLCRDTAEKNGHDSIIEGDVIEAIDQYSNWKLQDLAAEWRVNYPYLFDLFVLFQNTSYLTSRRLLTDKLATVSRSLTTRYPQYADVFTTGTILDILFAIGFLGILKGGKAIYVFGSNQKVLVGDDKFVIHPCFRSALRSTGGLDVVPRDRMDDYFGGMEQGIAGNLGSVLFAQSAPRIRGDSSFRTRQQTLRLCQRVRRAAAQTELPAETIAEIERDLNALEARVSTDTGYDDMPSVLLSTESWFREASWRLGDNPMIDDFDARVLIGTLRECADEAGRLAGGRETGQYL